MRHIGVDLHTNSLTVCFLEEGKEERFATYKVDEILKHSTNNPYDLIELSMIMGHETPKITLNSYVHYDLIGLSL